jgi:hypothetical protein
VHECSTIEHVCRRAQNGVCDYDVHGRGGPAAVRTSYVSAHHKFFCPTPETISEVLDRKFGT